MLGVLCAAVNDRECCRTVSDGNHKIIERIDRSNKIEVVCGAGETNFSSGVASCREGLDDWGKSHNHHCWVICLQSIRKSLVASTFTNATLRVLPEDQAAAAARRRRSGRQPPAIRIFALYGSRTAAHVGRLFPLHADKSLVPASWGISKKL
jgi:hypothetical protein